MVLKTVKPVSQEKKKKFHKLSSQLLLGDPNNSNNFDVGHETEKKKDFLNLNFPMEHGIITEWDNMEKVWKHTFEKELKIDQLNTMFYLVKQQ